MLKKAKKLATSKTTIVLPVDCCISKNMIVRLNSLKSNGRLEWTLTPEQIEFIKTYYSYSVLPYIYRIHTQKFDNFTNQPAIIKKIMKGAYSGKKYITTSLKKQDIVVLEQFGIFYTPFKYVITTMV